MSWIDEGQELLALEERFDALLRSKLPHFAATSKQLEEKLALRHAGGGWVRGFSPLVALYPLLQAQALTESMKPAARDVCLAHVLLLVHAFVDDRLIDRDLALDRGEQLFSRQVFAEASRLLVAVAGTAARAETALYDDVRYYCVAQMTPYAAVRGEDEVLSVVAGRAALGAIATAVLLEAAGATPAIRRRAREAYDALVVGLQWEDDLVDLDSDRSRGKENLLLHLGERGRSPAVEAAAHWTRASSVQAELGASQLAAILARRAESIRTLRGSAVSAQ